MTKKLTDKQQRFVQEYLIDLNATQACIRAGYSENTAKQMGSENLSKPDVQAEIEKARSKTSNKLEITRERVLQEIAGIAFEEIKGLADPDLNLPSYSDKNSALEKLSKHLGLFEQDNSQKAPTIIISKDDAEL